MVKQKDGGVEIKKWETAVEEFFVKKLPTLPSNVKEFIVKFGPWIALVSLLLSLPTLLMALGLYSAFVPAGYRYGLHYGYNIAWWISIASMGLSAWALPGLFKRKISAWKLMYYSVLLMGVYYLVSVSFGSLIIGTGISLYVLFQIKSYYK